MFVNGATIGRADIAALHKRIHKALHLALTAFIVAVIISAMRREHVCQDVFSIYLTL